MRWDEAKRIILKNKEVQEELSNNEAEYKIIEEIVKTARAVGKELVIRMV